VLGASAALGDHLARHPEDARCSAARTALRSPGAGRTACGSADGCGRQAGRPGARSPVRPGHRTGNPATALPAAYRRRLLHLAARDLTGAVTVDETAAELADLAAAALEAALAIARAQLPPDSAPARLAVIAMGKCGGRELNYASDVDVIFVAAPADSPQPAEPGPDAAHAGPHPSGAETAALRTATRLAAGLVRTCSQSTAEGALFPVDPNLRPEGRDGPLARTLASHIAYYQRWAKTWEFQALLKARPVAVTGSWGQAYNRRAQPDGVAGGPAPQLRRGRPGHAAPRDRQPGPRRGSAPAQARPAGCATSSSRCSYSAGATGAPTSRCARRARYPPWPRWPAAGTWARGCGQHGRRLPVPAHRGASAAAPPAPPHPHAARGPGRVCAGWAARCAGPRTRNGAAAPAPPSRADPAAELMAQWRQHAREARRLHEKLFYRPLLDAVARLPADAVRLTREDAHARLEALGYADPAGALRHIEALTSGVSRRASIQRTLLP